METGVDAIRQPEHAADVSRWRAIDWAMKGITLAMRLCDLADLPDLSSELGEIHESARQRRDEAV